MLYPLIRRLLFQLEPETAHRFTLNTLSFLNRLHCVSPFFKTIENPIKLFGLNFPNRVGLAAGFDRNVEYVDALSALGFGFIEVGTIVLRPQAGNPKPRLFRLIEDEALINRIGFASKGLDYALKQLEQLNYRGILGINIGKNKETSSEKAIDEYRTLFKSLAKYASYITINISSPNTPGLRDLQQSDYLENLLRGLKTEQSTVAQQQQKYVPIIVKIAPDLSSDELERMANTFGTVGIDGIIATNTTVSRTGTISHLSSESGGLSGRPLQAMGTKVIRELNRLLQDQVPIIASGGVMDEQTAAEKLAAGAKLLQIYTGFIYSGPGLIARLAR